MRIDLAFPNRGIAVAIFKRYGFTTDYTEVDGKKHDFDTIYADKSFLMMRDVIYGKPVDTGRKDADGLAVMDPGAKMKSAKGREYHVDAYLYEPMIEVTGLDAEGNSIWGGGMLDELSDYILTIPEGQAPAYVVAGEARQRQGSPDNLEH